MPEIQRITNHKLRRVVGEYGVRSISFMRYHRKVTTLYSSYGRELQLAQQEARGKTPLEEKLGVYLKQIEPHVKDAVVRLNEDLGYTTVHSGFELVEIAGHPKYISTIIVENKLNDTTKNTLEAIGVDVAERILQDTDAHGTPIKGGELVELSEIYFIPNKPNEQEMIAKWNQILDILPPTAIIPSPQQKSRGIHRRNEERYSQYTLEQQRIARYRSGRRQQ